VNATTFDTHRIVKRLVQAGFSDAQAETVTDVVRESRDFDFASLATKADLANLALATKAELANFATKADLANFANKADLANLATKADLANLATKAELANLATKAEQANFATKADVAATVEAAKNDILKWVVGLVLVQGGIVFALMKLG
jgi:hypothetical protein